MAGRFIIVHKRRYNERTNLILGDHVKQGNAISPLGIFGDAIARTAIPPVSEAATDLLAQAMLQICNCDPFHMVAFPQRGQFEVTVCGD